MVVRRPRSGPKYEESSRALRLLVGDTRARPSGTQRRPGSKEHEISKHAPTGVRNALAHLPSGKFTANAAWLVLAVIAFNLTRAAATITGPGLAKATTATIRRKLIAVPARIASSARRVTLHLPTSWPWESAWSELFNRACGPPPAPTT